MSLETFVRQNRNKLDMWIRSKCPNIGKLSDRERGLWVVNDEQLYAWAINAGVRL